MRTQPHVIVIGLGAVGSAALYQLARRGVKAIGLDRFAPPHDQGSSHGETRITRLGIGEGGHYVQFALRSHEIWRELEAATGRSLLRSVGGLIYGSTAAHGQAHGAADFLQTTIDAAVHHGIDHEVLNATVLAERFPQFHFRGDERGYFEPAAGFVHPEQCIAAQLEAAQRCGADVRTDERVMAWRPSANGVTVTTDRNVYEASRCIVAAGAWLPELFPALRRQAKVFRQVLFWFQPEGPHELFTPERLPVYIRVPDAGSSMFYGFPAINGPDGGLKIAGEQFDVECAPDDIERDVSPRETAQMHTIAAPHLRITNRCVRAVACVYTVTPDFQFIIDHHPETDRMWFASACSGHGFKHSAAVGEALAEMTMAGRTRFDLTPFALARYSGSPGLPRKTGPSSFQPNN